LDIPHLSGICNDYALSGHWGDIQKLPSLPATKRPKRCSDYRTCTAHCPQKIDILTAIEKLKKGAAAFAS
jgi:succinate dehydrogenase/fumarate reductase-like Fe-S protein